ncbi:molybdenum ABC transporter permease subunit [Caldovatus sediminis]|uniref:Molybdenum transport system permease n=1 Tax=Caldovatus sediminis TaxID=2041189 RepID=A0A8J3EAK8_9PROT|nr:molybdate ABC transporter permease subunit [Caldovatus sediminis]GGG28282.1 molybdenum ABC transporter permease subunit [Caldovatus sediminis]
MDWTAFRLSVALGAWTLLLLLPLALWLGRRLAYRPFPGRGFVEAVVALPLVLPPTVLGFYLLVAFGGLSPLGRAWQAVFGHGLAFSFEGLLFASVLVNLPFAVQPVRNAFAAIPPQLRDAGAVSGMTPARVLLRVELPLAWPGIATAAVLTFAHTLGEFGVVLMVGGAIPGETQTIAIAIYDRVQAFDERGAAVMSAVLLAVSVVALGLTNTLSGRVGRRTRDA